MANQLTPVIDAVQDFTLEKVILSGSPFVSSILGPGAYRITADLAPLFYTNPVVTGEVLPPSTFYCGEGSFNSSPRADLSYQWFYDGDLMLGANDKTIEIDDLGKVFSLYGTDTLNNYPSFLGTTGSLVLASNVAFPTTEITVEFWVNTSDITKTSGMVAYAVANEDNEFIVYDQNSVEIHMRGTSVDTGVAINNGEWRHIAVTWESEFGELILYVDGNPVFNDIRDVGQAFETGGFLALGQEFDDFGGGFQSTQSLIGEMSDVRVWNTVRSPGEIETNRFDRLVGDETGLVLYWPLDEGTGTVANDLSPSGTDGVYSGTTWNTLNDGPVYIEREIGTIYGGYQPFYCQVTATNGSGSTMAQSNDHSLETITPSFIGEMDVMTIGGMSDPWRAVVTTAEINIFAGIPHQAKIDCNELDLYVTLGIPHASKIDLYEVSMYSITGVTNSMKIDLIEAFIFPITGISNTASIDVTEANAYVMQTYTRLGTLALINSDAEAADMTAWTIEIGDVTAVSSATGNAIDYNRTGQFFKGEDRGQGLDSQMSQVVVIDGGLLTDVDLGRVVAAPSFRFYAGDTVDGIKITLEALDAADGVLNTQVGPLHLYPHTETGPGWYTITADGPPLNLPTLTRKIKITILFEMSDTAGSENNAYIDNIVVDLLNLE